MWLGKIDLPNSENELIFDQSETTRKIYWWNTVVLYGDFVPLTQKHSDMEKRHMKEIDMENQE